MRSFTRSSKIIIAFATRFNNMNLLSNINITLEKKCASTLEKIYYYLFVWLKLINPIYCYIFYFNIHLKKNYRHLFYSKIKDNHFYYLFILLLLFSSSSIQTINATTSFTQITTEAFTETANTVQPPILELDYDLNLFNELNMLETIQNLFRSCFKDSYVEIKEQLSKLHNLNSQTTSDNAHFKELLINQILNKLLDRDLTKLSLKFLDLIDSICLSTSSLNQFKSYIKLSNRNKHEDEISKKMLRDNFDLINKLYLLSDYEHYLCGNIFRNSMSSSHLYDHVLKLNPNKTNNNKLEVKLKSKNNSNKDKNNSSISNKISNNQFINFINMYSSKSLTSSSVGAKKLTNLRDIQFNNNYNINDIDEFNLNKTNSNHIKKNKYNNNQQTNLFPPKYKMKELAINNCSLILLNVYLLAFKSSCDYESFIESLNHYDCHSNNFSVKSNCDKCQVRK